MNSIKVLHIGKYGFNYKGGIESVCKSLALNKEVTQFFLFFGSNKENKTFKEFKFSKIFGQPISVRQFIYFLRIRKQYDLFHIHYPNLQMYLVMPFVDKKKIIIHYHSDIEKNKIVNSFFSLLDQIFGLVKCNLVFTSPDYKEYTQNKKNLKNCKTTIIPIGIQKKDKIKQNKEIDVISVGRLVNYKNHIGFLEAYVKNDCKFKYVIVGKGPNQVLIDKFIKDKNLENNVTLKTNVTDSELNILLNKSKIFALPSNRRSEAFGVVLLEALSIGIPIITKQINGSGVNYVNHKTSKSVCKNELEMTSKIKTLLNNRMLYERVSKESYNRFISDFTFNKMNESFTKLYISCQL